jgi:putative transposase
VDQAFQRFFKKTSHYPKFHKKGKKDSFCLPQHCKLDQQNGRISLPKIGLVPYVNSRVVEGKIKNVTVSKAASGWYISIQTERKVDAPVSQATTCCGIDLGIVRAVTLDNGEYKKPFDGEKKYRKRIANLQRSLSRKQRGFRPKKNKEEKNRTIKREEEKAKGTDQEQERQVKKEKRVPASKNYEKAKTKLSKCYEKVANARKDHLHKITSELAGKHGFIAMEDLRLKNMTKSSKGTLESPGKMVKQKSGLNRELLNQGLGEFRRQLEYKMAWKGHILLFVDPKNTSRTCPKCRNTSKKNRKNQASFLCVRCGYKENADVVGAINILQKGHVILTGTTAGGTLRTQPPVDRCRGRLEKDANLSKAEDIQEKQVPTEGNLNA